MGDLDPCRKTSEAQDTLKVMFILLNSAAAWDAGSIYGDTRYRHYSWACTVAAQMYLWNNNNKKTEEREKGTRLKHIFISNKSGSSLFPTSSAHEEP